MTVPRVLGILQKEQKVTQDFFQTACEHGIKIFLIKNNITNLQKKDDFTYKQNHLKLEEKERESTFFSPKRMATYGYHNMVQPSILPVTVALLPLWNP